MTERGPAAGGEPDERPRRGRPRNAAADAAILHAFLETLAEAGYAGATMDAIAERAGVAKTTIYRRWATREALMLAAHGLLMEEHPPPDTGSLAGDLHAFMRLMIESLASRPLDRVIAATIGEAVHNAEVARILRETVIRQRLDRMDLVFRRAAERGEIESPEHSRTYAQMLVGPVMFRIVISGEPVDGAFGETLVDAVLRAVGARRA